MLRRQAGKCRVRKEGVRNPEDRGVQTVLRPEQPVLAFGCQQSAAGAVARGVSGEVREEGGRRANTQSVSSKPRKLANENEYVS